MADCSDILRLVGRHWEISASQTIESLGSAGGFSGARFWRLKSDVGELCLRRWPREHPSAERLAWVHQVLVEAAKSGIDCLPVPVRTTAGGTFAADGGHLWELTPWLAGEADFKRKPSSARLRAAFVALAQFHLAAQGAASTSQLVVDAAPAVVTRCRRLDEFLAGGLPRISRHVRTGDWPELEPRARQIVGCASAMCDAHRRQLEPLRELKVRLQPVIRDIWHDHVLFTGDRVTGIVDFGAMQVDTVATDIARLAGSLVGDDRAGRESALAAYESVRPLSPDEAALVVPLDCSGTLIGALNWLDWIYCERREFEWRETIIARLDRMIARMEAW
ncbi:MAG: phosphotransferase [Pirellulales bacterium]|nr:phosphotransferase [Pirellulales bacterium]